MQIVAAAVAVHVQHLAAGIEPGHQAAFHCLFVKFPGKDSPRRHLGAVHAHRLGKRYFKRLGGPHRLFYKPVRQFPDGVLTGDVHRLGQHPAQPVVEDAGEQLRSGQRRGPAAAQFFQKDFPLHLGQEVQPAAPVPFFLADIPGEFKNHRPGQAVFRKLQFSLTGLHRNSVPQDFRPAVGPDTLQPYHAAPVGFQLNQGGPQPGAVVTEAAQKLVAGHGASQPGARQAAAGDDQALAVQGFFPEFQPEAPGGFLHFFHFRPQLHGDVGFFQGKTQHIQNRIGLVGVRIHPPGFLRHGEQSQLPEPSQCPFRREGFQGIFRKGRVIPMVAPFGGMEIG